MMKVEMINQFRHLLHLGWFKWRLWKMDRLIVRANFALKKDNLENCEAIQAKLEMEIEDMERRRIKKPEINPDES